MVSDPPTSYLLSWRLSVQTLRPSHSCSASQATTRSWTAIRPLRSNARPSKRPHSFPVRRGREVAHYRNQRTVAALPPCFHLLDSYGGPIERTVRAEVVRDINLSQRIVTLHKTKPGKTRHVPLNEVAMTALKSIALDRTPDSPVFVNTEDNPLRSPRDWFKPAVEEAGLLNCTWHCNRHTFAS